MNKQIITILTLLTLISCNSSTEVNKRNSADTTTLKPDDKPTLTLGERLKVSGDFDGDSKIDTVYESYISALTNKETNKHFEKDSWEDEIEFIIKNKPISRLYGNLIGTDTFVVTNESQQIGVEYFANLGDLNNDKADEIGYVIDWADYSNLNTYHIITLTKEKKWKEIFNFQINEAISYEPENLFDGKFIIVKDGQSKIKYKFYSDSATVEQSEKTFQ